MSRTPRSRGFPRMTAAFRSGLINARTGRAGSQRLSKGGSTSMANVTTRRVVAAVVALIGGYLLYVSADPASGFGTTLLAFWAGVALFVAVGAVLIRYYQPGVDALSADEVDVRALPALWPGGRPALPRTAPLPRLRVDPGRAAQAGRPGLDADRAGFAG